MAHQTRAASLPTLTGGDRTMTGHARSLAEATSATGKSGQHESFPGEPR